MLNNRIESQVSNCSKDSNNNPNNIVVLNSGLVLNENQEQSTQQYGTQLNQMFSNILNSPRSHSEAQDRNCSQKFLDQSLQQQQQHPQQQQFSAQPQQNSNINQQLNNSLSNSNNTFRSKSNSFSQYSVNSHNNNQQDPVIQEQPSLILQQANANSGSVTNINNNINNNNPSSTYMQQSTDALEGASRRKLLFSQQPFSKQEIEEDVPLSPKNHHQKSNSKILKAKNQQPSSTQQQQTEMHVQPHQQQQQSSSVAASAQQQQQSGAQQINNNNSIQQQQQQYDDLMNQSNCPLSPYSSSHPQQQQQQQQSQSRQQKSCSISRHSQPSVKKARDQQSSPPPPNQQQQQAQPNIASNSLLQQQQQQQYQHHRHSQQQQQQQSHQQQINMYQSKAFYSSLLIKENSRKFFFTGSPANPNHNTNSLYYYNNGHNNSRKYNNRTEPRDSKTVWRYKALQIIVFVSRFMLIMRRILVFRRPQNLFSVQLRAINDEAAPSVYEGCWGVHKIDVDVLIKHENSLIATFGKYAKKYKILKKVFFRKCLRQLQPCQNAIAKFKTLVIRQLKPFDPFSNIYCFWEIFITCCTLATCCFIPLYIAFSQYQVSIEEDGNDSVIHQDFNKNQNSISENVFFIAVPILLFFDMIVKANTCQSEVILSYENSKKTVMATPQNSFFASFHTYLKGHFLFDLITLLSLFVVTSQQQYQYQVEQQQPNNSNNNSSNNQNMLQYLTLIKLVFLLRLFYQEDLVEKYKLFAIIVNKRRRAFLSLVLLLLHLLITLHFLACVWIFIGSVSRTDSTFSWLDTLQGIQKGTMSNINTNSNSLSTAQQNNANSSITTTNTQSSLQNSGNHQNLYLYAFLSVFRGLLGHLSAMNDAESVFLSLLLLIGLLLLGYVTTSLHFIQQDLKEVQKEFAQKMTAVSRYMAAHDVAAPQRRLATKYLQGQYLQGLENRLSTDQSLSCLSKFLKAEILRECNLRVLQNTPLLANIFSDAFLQKLALVMREVAYDAEELIVKENVVESPVLFIILKGQVELSLQIGQRSKMQIKPFKTLHEGQIFGELEFFTMDYQTQLSARAKAISRVAKIPLDDFLATIRDFPDDNEVFCYLKDSVIFRQDYRLLGAMCFSCMSSKHTLRNCPYLFYGQNKSTIVQRLQKQWAEEIKQFKRGGRPTRRNRAQKQVQQQEQNDNNINSSEVQQQQIHQINPSPNISQAQQQQQQQQQKQQQQQVQSQQQYVNSQSNIINNNSNSKRNNNNFINNNSKDLHSSIHRLSQPSNGGLGGDDDNDNDINMEEVNSNKKGQIKLTPKREDQNEPLVENSNQQLSFQNQQQNNNCIFQSYHFPQQQQQQQQNDMNSNYINQQPQKEPGRFHILQRLSELSQKAQIALENNIDFIEENLNYAQLQQDSDSSLNSSYHYEHNNGIDDIVESVSEDTVLKMIDSEMMHNLKFITQGNANQGQNGYISDTYINLGSSGNIIPPVISSECSIGNFVNSNNNVNTSMPNNNLQQQQQQQQLQQLQNEQKGRKRDTSIGKKIHLSEISELSNSFSDKDQPSLQLSSSKQMLQGSSSNNSNPSAIQLQKQQLQQQQQQQQSIWQQQSQQQQLLMHQQQQFPLSQQQQSELLPYIKSGSDQQVALKNNKQGQQLQQYNSDFHIQPDYCDEEIKLQSLQQQQQDLINNNQNRKQNRNRTNASNSSQSSYANNNNNPTSNNYTSNPNSQVGITLGGNINGNPTVINTSLQDNLDELYPQSKNSLIDNQDQSRSQTSLMQSHSKKSQKTLTNPPKMPSKSDNYLGSPNDNNQNNNNNNNNQLVNYQDEYHNQLNMILQKYQDLLNHSPQASFVANDNEDNWQFQSNFNTVKNFKYYFPENNIEKIVGIMSFKSKRTISKKNTKTKYSYKKNKTNRTNQQFSEIKQLL